MKDFKRIYPHPNLPLFPKRLLPYIADKAVNIHGYGQVHILKLTKQKLGDFPKTHQLACIRAVTVLTRNLIIKMSEDDLPKMGLGLPQYIKISDLTLNEGALAFMTNKPFFESCGPWRSASLIADKHGRNHLVGPRLFLALTLAGEAIKNSHPARAMEKTLESELGELVKNVLHSERNSQVFLRAHGWNGNGQESLRAIAEEFGLTHERVRQIVQSAESSLRKYSLQTGDLSRLRQGVGYLASQSPLKCCDAARALAQQSIAGASFEVQGLLDAAEFFGITSGMDRWVWEGSAFVRRKEPRKNEMAILMGLGLAQTLSQVHRDIRRELRREGVLHITEETEKLKLKHGVSENTVSLAFQIHADGKFTGSENDWFISLSTSERIRKLHALVRWSGPQNVAALMKSCNSSNLFTTKPPADVLLELINSSNLFAIKGEEINVIDLHAFDDSDDVRLENAIVIALNGAGGKMPRRLLRQRLVTDGENSADMVKQIRSSLVLNANGKTVELESVSDTLDTEISFLASMDPGSDFSSFSQDLLFGR